jgi:hypothetical protein
MTCAGNRERVALVGKKLLHSRCLGGSEWEYWYSLWVSASVFWFISCPPVAAADGVVIGFISRSGISAPFQRNFRTSVQNYNHTELSLSTIPSHDSWNFWFSQRWCDVFWLVKVYRLFSGSCCHRNFSSTPVMNAAWSSETSVHLYQTTRRHIWEYRALQ